MEMALEWGVGARRILRGIIEGLDCLKQTVKKKYVD